MAAEKTGTGNEGMWVAETLINSKGCKGIRAHGWKLTSGNFSLWPPSITKAPGIPVEKSLQNELGVTYV